MYLMSWRNKLTAQGRDAGPVNDFIDEADDIIKTYSSCNTVHTPLFVCRT